MDPYNNSEYQWPDQMESHEMNERAPINYNQNTYMTNNERENSVESLNIDTMRAKGSEQNGRGRSCYNEVPKEGSYVTIWKYMEQIKSISAGLLLLLCGGMHTVWAIYQVLFYQTSDLYRKDLSNINVTVNQSEWEVVFSKIVTFDGRAFLIFTIVMWYFGIMLGCFAAGYFLVRVVQKRNIYYIGALVMFISGCLFYSADITHTSWEILLLFARFVAGLGYGVVYVTVFVQASENASKDFRRSLVTGIGLTIGFSIFIASAFLINIPIPSKLVHDRKSENIVESSELMSAGITATTTFVLCFVSVVINYFFSHETVPFLLYHNYREDEAQFTVAKLHGEDPNSAVVMQELQSIRELCHEDYAEFPEGKIFTSNHRGLLSLVLSARISSAQCFIMLCIVFFVKYIQTSFYQDLDELIKQIHNRSPEDASNETIIAKDVTGIEELNDTYRIAVRSLIVAWFLTGLQFTLIGNYFNWKRSFHLATSVVGLSILVYTVFRIVGLLHGLFKALTILLLAIYIHFLSLPVDILGYTYLTECFPISTKSTAIAFVTICENSVNSLLITMQIHHLDLSLSIHFMGLLFFVLGYIVFSNVGNTNGLSLGAAKHAYLQAVSRSKWWIPI